MTNSLASALAGLTTEESPFLFPDELLGEIFTHCDAATLAAVSKVSFACLELTSKLLYTDVTISDAKSVAILVRLESSAGTYPPLSARVSAHTSLSLIHSVTLYDEGELYLSALDAHKPFHPPIAIEVLAVSVCTTAIDCWGQGRLPRFNLRPAMSLFNPRIFLLRGRRAPLPAPLPDITRLVEIGDPNSDDWRTQLRPRPAFVIQSGVSIVPMDLRLLQASAADNVGSLPPSVKLIWDLLDIQADPWKEARQTWMISALFFFCGIVQDACARGWVGSQDIKADIQSRFHDEYGVPGADAPSIVDVPSDRVRRLRDAFVKHGVRKDMDWAALDDL